MTWRLLDLDTLCFLEYWCLRLVHNAFTFISDYCDDLAFQVYWDTLLTTQSHPDQIWHSGTTLYEQVKVVGYATLAREPRSLQHTLYFLLDRNWLSGTPKLRESKMCSGGRFCCPSYASPLSSERWVNCFGMNPYTQSLTIKVCALHSFTNRSTGWHLTRLKLHIYQSELDKRIRKRTIVTKEC